VRPCLIHAWHAVPMPRPRSATTTPFWKGLLKATAYDTWRIQYFRFTSFPSSERRQSPHAITTCSSQISMLATVRNNTSRIRKRIRETVGVAVRILPATTRTFTKNTALSKHRRGAARHGRGKAGARHGMCELAFSLQKNYKRKASKLWLCRWQSHLGEGKLTDPAGK